MLSVASARAPACSHDDAHTARGHAASLAAAARIFACLRRSAVPGLADSWPALQAGEHGQSLIVAAVEFNGE